MGAGGPVAYWSGIALAGISISVWSLMAWTGAAVRFCDHLADRLYADEGQAGPTLERISAEPATRVVRLVLGLTLTCIILVSMATGSTIPERYFIPATALVFVPLSVFSISAYRTRFGLLPLLSPILYAIHALLVLLGAPLSFAGQWSHILNLLPWIAYVLLALLLAHLYSRMALRRLRRLVAIGESGHGAAPSA